MTVSPISRRIVAGLLAVALAPAAALAQPEAATGMPRQLGDVQPEPQNGPDADPSPDVSMPVPEEGGPAGIVLPAPVTVGDLGRVEGPVVGTLDDTSGSLGAEIWRGTDRTRIDAALGRAVPTSSSTAHLLLRSALLTPAPPPGGSGDDPFQALRIRKLLDGGHVDDAADLAAQIQSRDAATHIAQAEALLLAGRDEVACSDVTATRLASAEVFWVQLRGYCYALANDIAALDLTRAVMEQQRLADAGFLALLDATVSAQPGTLPPLADVTPVMLRMLVRLDAPIPEAALALGLPADLIAAASTETPAPLRLSAGERALRAGMLPSATLGELLDLISFRPANLANAAAIARGEPLVAGLARLRAAQLDERDPERRVELLRAMLQIGEREAVLPVVAGLVAADVAAVMPRPEWSPWAPLFVRGLLLADEPLAASRWLDVLEGADNPVAAHTLRITYGLLRPGDPRGALLEESLLALAHNPDAEASPQTALILGLYEATGRDMPIEARAKADTLLTRALPGRRPAPISIERVESAALANRPGEVALTMLDVLGGTGAADLAADVVVRLVRSLRTAGLNEAARSLTAEALLTRPSGT